MKTVRTPIASIVSVRGSRCSPARPSHHFTQDAGMDLDPDTSGRQGGRFLLPWRKSDSCVPRRRQAAPSFTPLCRLARRAMKLKVRVKGIIDDLCRCTTVKQVCSRTPGAVAFAIAVRADAVAAIYAARRCRSCCDPCRFHCFQGLPLPLAKFLKKLVSDGTYLPSWVRPRSLLRSRAVGVTCGAVPDRSRA